MTRYEQAQQSLRSHPRTWLVTGAAGFIGSHLVERLLTLGQQVVGLDNFATGHRRNLVDVHERIGDSPWSGFRFIEGDIRDLGICRDVCVGADIVLHQAALGSVPRSIENPITTNQANIDGFLNMLVASRDAGVRRFVYAASSSTYGDHPGLPKVEARIGRPMSPYAVTKLVNELYANVFARCYQYHTIGLRYFNVFGRRQDPNGAYAAVIPRWVGELLRGQRCRINGDGETSRDFCYIENVIQANVLAATVEDESATDQVYNVAFGERTTLNDLYSLIRNGLSVYRSDLASVDPVYGDFRAGDVRHSQADITKARELLGYEPSHNVSEGLKETLAWYATAGNVVVAGADSYRIQHIGGPHAAKRQ